MSSDTSFPILAVDDLPVVVAFYERLGFRQTYAFPDAGPAAFVTLERRGCAVGVAVRGDGDGVFSYWTYVDDVDATFAALAAAGAPVHAPPRTEPWGERVASVRDPQGNVVHLGAPVSSSQTTATPSDTTPEST